MSGTYPSVYVAPPLSFHSLVTGIWAQAKLEPFSGTLLSIDPGATTGVANFNSDGLISTNEIPTPNIEEAAISLDYIITSVKPTQVVIEDYRIYSWRAKQHAWSDLLTPRIIGAVETMCTLQHIPIVKQSAQVAKQFVTDSRLKGWDFWQKGKPHARDAIRHGCYWLLFNYKGNASDKET